MKNILFKTGLLVLLYVSCLVLLSSNQASAMPRNHPAKNQEEAKYCFVQSAAKATIAAEQKEANAYVITLTHVSPHVTYFSERPNRNVGSMPIKEFIKLWERKGANSFQASPPNAALNGIQMQASVADTSLNFVFELTNPKYDPQSQSLTYTAKLLKGALIPAPQSLTLDHVTLFIDDVCLVCWGHG